jgi:hypothetical protein
VLFFAIPPAFPYVINVPDPDIAPFVPEAWLF